MTSLKDFFSSLLNKPQIANRELLEERVRYDRRLCDDKIELVKVNATRQVIANAKTNTIKGPSTKHHNHKQDTGH